MTSTTAPLVRVRGLTKRYGTRTVLQGLDLDIPRGAVTAVIGPNGAGKTTLNKALLGLVRADGGTVHFDGTDTAGAIAYRARIGYMPQTPRYPDAFSAGDVLHLLRDFRGADTDTDDTLIDAFALGPLLSRPARALSGGQRQRLNAAAAFLFRPDLLLLDEPTAGLDPIASGILKDAIARVRGEGRAVVITSHILSELQELADRVVFLHEGRIHWSGPLDDLLTMCGTKSLERAIAQLMRESMQPAPPHSTDAAPQPMMATRDRMSS
ncbi:MAG: ABC transporter ATP-binding protein [Gemmatimonadetes bacterium]|nr:ABC transporter ATP-binding protein [Gemmatimonadota bacterium]